MRGRTLRLSHSSVGPLEFISYLGLTSRVSLIASPDIDLPRALSRGEIFPVFQPEVDLASGMVVAVEALCRWLHPERGMISPAEFIPVAESTGDIHELGQFMLEKSLAAAAAWRESGADISVSVNVSPLQFEGPTFVEDLADRIRSRGLQDGALTVEITESMPVIHPSTLATRLEQLRSLGVGLALDDYGTGHSSADRVTRLPWTEIKIDRTLVQSNDADAVRGREGVMAEALARGLRVVAEGVETAAQLTMVRELGCHRAQGYLLGRPMPAVDIDELLAAAS